MIGEFAGNHGEQYTMIVNLSLRDSAQFNLTPTDPQTEMQQVSPVDGSLSPLDPGNSLWLTAGGGVLIKFSPAGSN